MALVKSAPAGCGPFR